MPQYDYRCPAGHVTTDIRKIREREDPGPVCKWCVTEHQPTAPPHELMGLVCRPCLQPSTLIDEIPAAQAPPRPGEEFRWIVNDRHVRAETGEKKRGRRIQG